MGAIETLVHRNREFAASRFSPQLTIAPRLGTTVIGCLDPRIDPAHVLGLDLGDAPVIRNVGGRVTPATLQNLDLLALGFPAPADRRPEDRMALVVLQHTGCGITRMQGAPEALAAYFGVDTSEVAGKSVADPRAAVAVDVAELLAHPGVADAYTVSGLVYDVATGLVEVVVPAEVAA